MKNKKEKAYKVLANQLDISHGKAKELIDRGVVFIGNKKIKIARAEVDSNVHFKLLNIPKIEKVFEDSNLFVINKPPFLTSEEIEKQIGFRLLHRLDKETSGILILVKNKKFQKEAIEEFKNGKVYKEYTAWVEGMIAEGKKINFPIFTYKKNQKLVSKISFSKGKKALSIVEPLEIAGKFTKVKVTISTGRTHQIRIHLSKISHPIVGDSQYGGKEFKRMLLHCKKMKFLGYSFEAGESFDFKPVF